MRAGRVDVSEEWLEASSVQNRIGESPISSATSEETNCKKVTSDASLGQVRRIGCEEGDSEGGGSVDEMGLGSAVGLMT